MRQLRFLRPGDDGNHMILETADGAEQFVLYTTVSLRDAIRADLPRLTHTETETGQQQQQPEATISPREIQVRVRAGADPQALAEENGMSLQRVLRFAGPVLDERTRVAHEAKRARARRSTTEGQMVAFGEAVDSRFSAHGIDPFTVTWDAYRRIDGQWVVAASWIGGTDQHTAEWAFNLAGRSIAPIDDTAAELLSDRPVRPLAPVPDEPVRPTLAAAPPLAPGVVAFPVLTEVPAADEPAPAAEDVFDQDALDDPRHVQVASTEAHDDDTHAPPLPLRLADKPGADADASADPPTGEDARTRTKPLPRLKNLGVASRDETPVPAARKSSSRPHVPAWDDIMLGVRRTTD